MEAESLLQQGKLDECLSTLKLQIQSDPSNSKLRVFLFQAFCASGEWERALSQLSVLKDLDPMTMPMVQTYQAAIQCERIRQDVFRGDRAPLVLGEPPPWMANLLTVSKLVADGHVPEALRARDEALEDAPAVAGTINGQAFEWLADGDSRLGPVLEVMLNANYYWVPMIRIARVTIEAPTDLRDLFWLPANITWSNGGEAVGLIPVRYPNSETDEDTRIQLSRMTRWSEPEEGFYVGHGQRLLTTDSGDHALLDTREITFETAADEQAAVH
ncbi:MAG: type VI secretion system accessory protein TagJ [Xanthomonadales bacterium]|nr:type VI secretion system accessory protein TagJ [Xanthomonadales bacterium]